MVNYDFIYSVVAHESPECIWNLRDNIIKTHPGKKVLIVIAVNNYLAEVMPYDGTSRDHVIFNSDIRDRQKYTSDIFIAHLSNYRMVEKYSFSYFCTLSSNCLFLKEPDYDRIEMGTPKLAVTGNSPGFKIPDTTANFWDEFRKNDILLRFFKEFNIEPVLRNHEGVYYRRSVINYISWAAVLGGIKKEAFTNDVLAFEEVLFPSLEKLATGVVSRRYCGLIPEIKESDIMSIFTTGGCPSLVGNHYNIVKVPRDMGDPLRKLVNSLV